MKNLPVFIMQVVVFARNVAAGGCTGFERMYFDNRVFGSIRENLKRPQAEIYDIYAACSELLYTPGQ